MRISDLLKMSLDSLFKRKVRTILTVLGVIIGTTSIVVMISLGIGMKASMLEEMESYGSLTAITVYEAGRYDYDSKDKTEPLFLNDSLIEQLQQLDHVESVDAMLEVNVIVKSGIYEANTALCGMTYEAMKRKNIAIREGKLPADEQELSLFYGNSVLQNFINSKTKKYVYWEDGTIPDIDLMKDTVYVIFDTDKYLQAGQKDIRGQLIPMPKKYVIPTSGVRAGDIEDWGEDSGRILCNIEALKLELRRIFKKNPIPGQPTRKNGKPYTDIMYSRLKVNVDTMENVTEVQQLINQMGYETSAQAEWIESDMQLMNVVQAVLGGIGAISLLVAAIGITNTMMMSIYERTKEIGVMKVIGCRIRDIQALFLIEAGYIGLIGGSLGVGLSYLLSVIINHVMANSDMLNMAAGSAISRIPLWLCGVAVIFAVLIAMLAGFFPSIRAMRLSPLAAIRAE